MGSNQTWISEVILLGFQIDPELEVFLFGLLLLFYSLTLLGNGVILGLICLDSRLHTPMYFFLSHLAIVDMAYASSTVPKMLANLILQKKTISFAPCILQTFLYLAFAVTECLSLVVMSYDRYVAICHPLYYSVIMSWRVCTVLAATCWIFSFLLALVHISLILRLPFCGAQKINHFFLSNHISIQIGLCRHQAQPNCPVCRLRVCLSRAPLPGSGLLCTDPGRHPEDPVSWGPQEGLLHLLLPPLCGRALLWHCHRHVLGAQVQPFSRTKEDSVIVLQSFQPYAESLNLQFEECRGEGCPEEISGEEEILVRDGLKYGVWACPCDSEPWMSFESFNKPCTLYFGILIKWENKYLYCLSSW